MATSARKHYEEFVLAKEQAPMSFTAAIAFPTTQGEDPIYVVFGAPDFPEPKDLEELQLKLSCFNCKQPGHRAKDCPLPKIRRCKNCDEPDHSTRACPKPTQCLNCGAKSHMFGDCEEAPRNALKLPGREETEPESANAEADIRIHINREHVTHVTLNLSLAYHRHKEDSFLTRTNVNMKLFNSNLGGVTCEQVRLTDLNRIENLFHTIPVDALQRYQMTDELYLVTFEFTPRHAGHANGTNFFTFSEFGEHTESIELVRSYLHNEANNRSNKTTMKIYALTRSTGDLTAKVMTVMEHFSFQKNSDNVSRWFKNGKLHCQLGMQLEKSDRPAYMLAGKDTFFTMGEYLTIHFYGALAIHENVAPAHARKEAKIRFAALPFSGRKFIAFIEMSSEFRLSPGDRIRVCFNIETQLRDHDWTAEIIAPVPFSTTQDYSAILSRPYIKDKEDGHFDDTVIPEQSIIKITDQDTTESVREQLTTILPTRAQIQIEDSDKTTRRQLNALREIQQNVDGRYTRLADILTAGNLRGLKKIDAFRHFAKRHGEDALQRAVSTYCANHNKEQQEADRALRDLTGGILLVQGAPGTGKSEWIIDNIAVCFSFATLENPAQIVLLSGSNAPLDELARKIFVKLYGIYEFDTDKRKYPIVIREHAIQTEIDVYRRDQSQSRTEKLGTRTPPPVQEDLDLSKLAVARMLLETYKQASAKTFEGIRDRRVQNMELSLGIWMLRVAGIRINGELHAVAHPDEERFREFRKFLRNFGQGMEFSPDIQQRFTLAAEDLRKHVHAIADVQLTTLSNYHQQKVYGEMKPNLVFIDEAAKAPELDSLAAFTWNQAPARIFVGDIHQLHPNPTVGKSGDLRPFGLQMEYSFFARAIRAGYRTVYLYTQHRYSGGITRVLNKIGYDHLVAHPAVETRKEVRDAKDFIYKTFAIKGTVAFLDLPSGKESRSETNPSKTNLINIRLALFVYLNLLKKGWRPDQIGLATPYTAQVHQYVATLHNAVPYLHNFRGTAEDEKCFRPLANKVKDTQAFTFDSVQGLEREVIIVDLTSTSHIGFLRDPARLVVALSRPRSMLIIIGNMEGLEKDNRRNSFKKTTLYKLFEYIKSIGACVSVTGERATKWVAPFAIATDLAERRLAYVHDNDAEALLAYEPREQEAKECNVMELIDADGNEIVPAA